MGIGLQFCLVGLPWPSNAMLPGCQGSVDGTCRDETLVVKVLLTGPVVLSHVYLLFRPVLRLF